MRSLLRLTLTDLIRIGCSDIGRGGVGVSGVREDKGVASQGACRIEGIVADALGRGFASVLAKEALGAAVACGAGVLGFACVFVLSRGVVAATVVTDLCVGRTVADRDFMS